MQVTETEEKTEEELKPRKLTREEIQDILNIIPDISSAAKTVSEYNSKSMKTMIKEQLQDIEIVPIGIPDLKNEIIRQWNMTQITPGTMVGVLAGDSISKPVTQAALNSFHTSGSSKNVIGGVERISELVNATHNAKLTSATIFFEDQNLTFEDILVKKRPDITEITVKDLVIGIPDIESSEIIENDEPEWYNFYRTFVRSDFKSREVLRLNIDVNVLYAYKITMEDVARVLELDGSIIAVYSPMSVGMIDVYPIESAISSSLSKNKIQSYENNALIFLTMIVIPNLDQLRISGISGIQQIYPVDAKVLQIIKEEVKDRENSWFLILNPIRMRITGITPEKLANLVTVCGLKVTRVKSYYLAVESVDSPIKFLNKVINEDEKRERELDKQDSEKRKKGIKVERREVSPINKASKLDICRLHW